MSKELWDKQVEIKLNRLQTWDSEFGEKMGVASIQQRWSYRKEDFLMVCSKDLEDYFPDSHF